MEENNYLSKKTKRKNDKNIPKYTKEDNLKYNIKNKIIEKEKKSKNIEEKNKDSKNSKKENERKNKKKKMKEEEREDEEVNREENEIEEEKELNSEGNGQYSIEEDDSHILEEENKKYNLYKKIKKKLIIILEGASLELGNLKKNPQILNCDDHYKTIKSMKKKLDEFRPDIVHQCLLSLFDSPLNKVGLLKVYIHTNKNILIEINPKTRMPRTFKRFSGLFTQLLLKNEIKTSDTNEVLLKVINSNIENILGKNIPKILLSEKGRLIDIDTYCRNLNMNLSSNSENMDNTKVCFIIGTNPKGDIDPFIKYNDDCISLSSFDLDSNVVCAKICTSFEKVWDVL